MRCPEAPARRRSASGATALGDRPVVVKRLAAPGRTTRRSSATRATSPTGAARPTCSAPGSSAAHPGPPRAVGGGGRGGRRRDHRSHGVGRGRRQQRPVRGACARPVRRRRPRPGRWLARDQLRDRLARVERRGGWPTLARTTVADVADHLWRRRTSLLDALDALPQVPQHGDPVPANLPGRDGRRRDRDRLGDARHRPGRRRPRLLRAVGAARSSSRCSTPT